MGIGGVNLHPKGHRHRANGTASRGGGRSLYPQGNRETINETAERSSGVNLNPKGHSGRTNETTARSGGVSVNLTSQTCTTQKAPARSGKVDDATAKDGQIGQLPQYLAFGHLLPLLPFLGSAPIYRFCILSFFYHFLPFFCII